MSGMEVMILNPRPTAGTKERAVARKRSRKRRARASAPKRRRRRNPGNPPRRRRRARAHHRRSPRRRARRNPGLPKLNIAGLDVMAIGIGAAGGLGTVMAVNLIAKPGADGKSILPEMLQSGWGKVALKGGLLVAAAMLLPRFIGRKMTTELVIGAGTVVVVDAAREFLAPHIPGLSDLMDSPFMDQEQLAGYLDQGGSLSGHNMSYRSTLDNNETEGFRPPWG